MKINQKDYIKIAASVFVLYLVIKYWSLVERVFSLLFAAAFPLILGGFIAYFVNILMSFYEKHYFPNRNKKIIIKSRRPISMLLAFFTVIAVGGIVLSLVVPQLISCVQLILSELPDAFNYIIEKCDELNIISDNYAGNLANIDWQSRIGEMVEVLTSGVGNIMNVAFKAVSSALSAIVTGILSIIFAIYILASKDKLKGQLVRVMKHYLPKKYYLKIFHVLSVLNDCFHRYFVGQCTEAGVLGVLCTGGMLILRLPYATMIGALVAFTALIPVAGAYIGAGVGAFVLLTVSPVKTLIFLLFIVILQQLEGNLIYPKVVGSSIGLPGIWVLAAVTIGGGIMGVVGMLLGVPLVATAYRLIREDVNGISPLRN